MSEAYSHIQVPLNNTTKRIRLDNVGELERHLILNFLKIFKTENWWNYKPFNSIV